MKRLIHWKDDTKKEQMRNKQKQFIKKKFVIFSISFILFVCIFIITIGINKTDASNKELQKNNNMFENSSICETTSPNPEKIEIEDVETTEPPIIKDVITENIVDNVEIEPEEDNEELISEYISLGEFCLTAYCPCIECCGKWSINRPIDTDGELIVYTASGEIAKECYTIAADTDLLPFGTKIYIDNVEYKVQDVGSSIKGHKLDIYFDNHCDSIEFGIQYKEVFIKNPDYDLT